jgi:hypothetical protein
MLEVYYRYLPTFMVVPEEKIEEEIGDEDDIGIDFGYNVPNQDEFNSLSIALSSEGELIPDLI